MSNNIVYKLCDGRLLKSVYSEDSEEYKKILDIVNSGTCEVNVAYLCVRYGCFDCLKCQVRQSVLNKKGVRLCTYERGIFFKVLGLTLAHKVTLDEAFRLWTKMCNLG